MSISPFLLEGYNLANYRFGKIRSGSLEDETWRRQMDIVLQVREGYFTILKGGEVRGRGEQQVKNSRLN